LVTAVGGRNCRASDIAIAEERDAGAGDFGAGSIRDDAAYRSGEAEDGWSEEECCEKTGEAARRDSDGNQTQENKRRHVGSFVPLGTGKRLGAPWTGLLTCADFSRLPKAEPNRFNSSGVMGFPRGTEELWPKSCLAPTIE
jgi:hypothetical protein